MGTSYATMIAPMFAADRYVGNIAVSRRAGDGFTASEQSLLKSFADQAVIAIENARLFNETQRALERQTATSEILKVIAASPSDTTPVFDAIALSANRLLGGLSTAVWRFEGDIAHLASYTPTGPEADAALRALSPMPVSQLSVFVLLRGGEIAELPDTEEGPPQLRDLARLRGYRSMLFVPLVLNGDAIGFVSVTRKLPGKYDPEDVQLLKTFADQAVIAIQNARMFNETKEALEQQKASAGVLGAIGRSVSDATPVFEEILTACQRLFGLNEMGIYTVDSDDMVRVAAWRGETRAEVKHDVTPLADSITGRILRERRTHHIPDLIEEPNLSPLVRERAERLGSASLLYAPMLLEDRGLGSILVVRSPPKPFTERETELLKTFADQAAIAIENARLFKETKEALERQEATGEILSAIGQSVSDAAPVFEKVLDACERLFAAHGIGIFLAGDDGMVRAAAIRGARAGEARNDVTPYADSVTAKVIEARTVHHIPDEAALPNLSDRIRDRVRRHGPSSLLYAPMLWKDRGLGSIVVRRAPPRPFGDKEQALLQSFANQAAIAIENARLFNETQARTKELSESLKQQTATSEVLKVISRSAFDLQVVLDTLVASARELCEADQGIIWIREGDLFRAKAAIGFDGSVKAFYALHPRRVSDKSLVPRVMRSGQVEHIPDTKLDPDYEPIAGQAEADRPRTLLGVPLVHGERVDGVVTVTRRRAEAFLPRQIELVRTFADQAVIAIENSRLFGEVQARTRELAASLEDLRRTQDRLVQTEKLASLGQLTAGIAHEIKNPLNFINNFSALSGELADELLEALAPAPLDAKTRDEVDDLARMIKDNLQKVVHHGKRADSIVKNMLLHSRTGASEHRLTDINATLEESLNLAYHGARAEKPGFNITMKRDLDPGAGMADVFPQEISRAFLNLISNGFYAAAKRAEGGGVEPELWVATKNLGETIEIRIRDNGTGIPEEIREKIFNPFFTTKPAGEGTGLGLSMTHDIVVKQHGGALDVESSPGSYTEFRIVLPRGGAPIREGERH
jgi:GAF domain-containing protein